MSYQDIINAAVKAATGGAGAPSQHAHQNCGGNCGQNVYVPSQYAPQQGTPMGYATPQNGMTGSAGSLCQQTVAGTVTCAAPLQSRGQTVQAQSNCVAPTCGPITKSFYECLGMLLVDCQSQQMFIVDSFNGNVFRFQPATCDFSATPESGGCPSNVSPVLAVERDQGTPNVFDFFICTAQGVYRWNGNANTRAYEPSAYPLAACPDIRCVVVDNSGQTPVIYTQKNLTIEDLRLDITAQFCVPP